MNSVDSKVGNVFVEPMHQMAEIVQQSRDDKRVRGPLQIGQARPGAACSVWETGSPTYCEPPFSRKIEKIRSTTPISKAFLKDFELGAKAA